MAGIYEPTVPWNVGKNLTGSNLTKYGLEESEIVNLSTELAFLFESFLPLKHPEYPKMNVTSGEYEGCEDVRDYSKEYKEEILSALPRGGVSGYSKSHKSCLEADVNGWGDATLVYAYAGKAAGSKVKIKPIGMKSYHNYIKSLQAQNIADTLIGEAVEWYLFSAVTCGLSALLKAAWTGIKLVAISLKSARKAQKGFKLVRFRNKFSQVLKYSTNEWKREAGIVKIEILENETRILLKDGKSFAKTIEADAGSLRWRMEVHRSVEQAKTGRLDLLSKEPSITPKPVVYKSELKLNRAKKRKAEKNAEKKEKQKQLNKERAEKEAQRKKKEQELAEQKKREFEKKQEQRKQEKKSGDTKPRPVSQQRIDKVIHDFEVQISNSAARLPGDPATKTFMDKLLTAARNGEITSKAELEALEDITRALKKLERKTVEPGDFFKFSYREELAGQLETKNVHQLLHDFKKGDLALNLERPGNILVAKGEGTIAVRRGTYDTQKGNWATPPTLKKAAGTRYSKAADFRKALINMRHNAQNMCAKGSKCTLEWRFGEHELKGGFMKPNQLHIHLEAKYPDGVIENYSIYLDLTELEVKSGKSVVSLAEVFSNSSGRLNVLSQKLSELRTAYNGKLLKNNSEVKEFIKELDTELDIYEKAKSEIEFSFPNGVLDNTAKGKIGDLFKEEISRINSWKSAIQ